VNERPLTLTTTRQLLTRLGHEPNRQLGQCFLVEGNIVRKSLELAAIAPGDRVVEIGPGLGTLSRALLATGAQVWAVECDPRLHDFLNRDLVPEAEGRFHLLHADAVQHPLAGLPAADSDGPFKIVANLPYAITTPWLDAVLQQPVLPERMVLMMQRETADRLRAGPGTKSFSAITVVLHSLFEPTRGHAVSSGCFWPRPEVESYLVSLVRRPEPFRFVPAARQLMRACFQERRKQIANLLRRHAPAAVAESWLAHLAAAGLDGRTRPEQIAVEHWQVLGRLLAKAG
jgi:16S rRNA (adenine1518-N6/adenine1519-N6)-dimethyltransferase